jgi:hypothetical protein
MVAVLLADSAGRSTSRSVMTEQRMVRTIGPFVLPRNAGHDVPLPDPVAFDVPRGGWIVAYDVELVDSAGRVAPRELLHHAELIDLERRELLTRRTMRIASVSHDTPELELPLPLGYPVREGQRLLVAPMLANPLDRRYVVSLRITLRWRAAAPGVELVNVATFNQAVALDDAGASSYDLPAGRSVQSREFAFPIGSRLVAISGHLHQYGQRLVLVRLRTGDTLFDRRPVLRADGTMERMPVAQLWRRDRLNGLAVRAGERFRLTAIYDNPTGVTVAGAGMATIGGVMVPDDWRRWPALDVTDPVIVADRRRLTDRGPQGGGHHDHHARHGH